jgi:hypothetical protein
MNNPFSDSSSNQSVRSEVTAAATEPISKHASLTTNRNEKDSSAGIFLERHESKPLPLSTQRYYSLNWKFWRIGCSSAPTYENPGAVVRRHAGTVNVIDHQQGDDGIRQEACGVLQS